VWMSRAWPVFCIGLSPCWIGCFGRFYTAAVGLIDYDSA
jgi:hypothetical protein